MEMSPLPVFRPSRRERGMNTVKADDTRTFTEPRLRSHMLRPAYTTQISTLSADSRTSKVTSRTSPPRCARLTARTSTRSLVDSRTSIGPLGPLMGTIAPDAIRLDHVKSDAVACAASGAVAASKLRPAAAKGLRINNQAREVGRRPKKMSSRHLRQLEGGYGLRRLAAGDWRLAAGDWKLATGGWRLAAASVALLSGE